MKRMQKVVVLCQLADHMAAKGSWCGETHLQKATYFLQRLLDVPTGFDFILYKYGPFSFDLREELAAMRADGFLDLAPQPMPYGPSLVPTELSKKVRERFPKTLRRRTKELQFVADQLSAEGVMGLEQLATALYVTLEKDDVAPEQRTEWIKNLKPHISIEDAAKSVETVDGIVERARKLRAARTGRTATTT